MVPVLVPELQHELQAGGPGAQHGQHEGEGQQQPAHGHLPAPHAPAREHQAEGGGQHKGGAHVPHGRDEAHDGVEEGHRPGDQGAAGAPQQGEQQPEQGALAVVGGGRCGGLGVRVEGGYEQQGRVRPHVQIDLQVQPGIQGDQAGTAHMLLVLLACLLASSHPIV